MKRIIFSLAMFLLSFSATASAADIPALILNNGANRVGVTLVNRTNTDAFAVSASVNGKNLPPWLSVQCEPGTATAPGGGRSARQLVLGFTVNDAPASAETVVPIVLRDAYGNTWNHPLTVRANVSAPVPDALIGNHPNPFNPDTLISFSLSTRRDARLVVYNSLGQKVRTLLDGPIAAGKHAVRWDGKDDAGRHVSSGVYYYKINAGKFSKARKMVMVE